MLYYKTIPTTHVAGMAQTQTQNKTRQNYYAISKSRRYNQTPSSASRTSRKFSLDFTIITV